MTRQHQLDRAELETKKRRANELFQELVLQVHRENGPGWFAEYLNGLIQFREVGEDTNKSQWDVSGWWADFIGTIEKVRVTLPKPKQTIAKVMDWFETNIAPMAAVIGTYDGEWLLETIREGSRRWAIRHKALLDACEFEPLPGAG